jgi:ribonuclease M5
VRLAEVVVVEGIHDVAAVKAAVDAHVVPVGGFRISAATRALVAEAHRRVGVIVLTDPDTAGEQIRRRLDALVGGCAHAWAPRAACTRDGNVGIENAAPDVIRAALSGARRVEPGPPTFSPTDLRAFGLVGTADARARRVALAERLGLGHPSGAQLLARLNHYGVSVAEVRTALAAGSRAVRVEPMATGGV